MAGRPVFEDRLAFRRHIRDQFRMRGLLDFCDDQEEHQAIQRTMAPLLSAWSDTAHKGCVELPMRGAAASSTDHDSQAIGTWSCPAGFLHTYSLIPSRPWHALIINPPPPPPSQITPLADQTLEDHQGWGNGKLSDFVTSTYTQTSCWSTIMISFGSEWVTSGDSPLVSWFTIVKACCRKKLELAQASLGMCSPSSPRPKTNLGCPKEPRGFNPYFLEIDWCSPSAMQSLQPRCAFSFFSHLFFNPFTMA